jgi:hypothetical protein
VFELRWRQIAGDYLTRPAVKPKHGVGSRSYLPMAGHKDCSRDQCRPDNDGNRVAHLTLGMRPVPPHFGQGGGLIFGGNPAGLGRKTVTAPVPLQAGHLSSIQSAFVSLLFIAASRAGW